LAGDPKPWQPEAVTVAGERLGVQATPGAGGMTRRVVFRSAHREVLWALTGGSWRTRTLPADNLDDPAVYLLAKGLAEVVDGRLRATSAGFELRKQIERER
jgi:hypothetical protein